MDVTLKGVQAEDLFPFVKMVLKQAEAEGKAKSKRVFLKTVGGSIGEKIKELAEKQVSEYLGASLTMARKPTPEEEERAKATFLMMGAELLLYFLTSVEGTPEDTGLYRRVRRWIDEAGDSGRGDIN